jgi:hypothetical protein
LLDKAPLRGVRQKVDSAAARCSLLAARCSLIIIMGKTQHHHSSVQIAKR